LDRYGEFQSVSQKEPGWVTQPFADGQISSEVTFQCAHFLDLATDEDDALEGELRGNATPRNTRSTRNVGLSHFFFGTMDTADESNCCGGGMPPSSRPPKASHTQPDALQGFKGHSVVKDMGIYIIAYRLPPPSGLS